MRSPAKEALELVHGERQKAYGHPSVNFERICRMWTEIFGVSVTFEMFTHAMIALKLARNLHAFKFDNWVDIAGYVEAGALARERPMALVEPVDTGESQLDGLEVTRALAALTWFEELPAKVHVTYGSTRREDRVVVMVDHPYLISASGPNLLKAVSNLYAYYLKRESQARRDSLEPPVVPAPRKA